MTTSSDNAWPWDVLGIDSNADERVVRRAYAKLLKQQRPDEDADAFQRLRYAYESALQMMSGSGTFIATTTTTEPTPKQAAGEARAAIQADPLRSPIPESAPQAALETSPAMRKHAAREEAAEIWRTFLAQPDTVSLRRSLTDLFDSVVSFSTRDELEWLALCACLNDETPAELKRALCAALGWRDNSAHLVQRDRVTATRALARIFADEDYLGLRVRFPRATELMEAPKRGVVGGLWAVRTIGVRDEMTALVPALRQYLANASRSRFDQTTFDFWVECLSLRAGIVSLFDTALLIGALCGILLACALVPAEKHRSIIAWGAREWSVAFAMLTVNLGIAAAWVFNLAPALTRHVQGLRQSPSVRYGWVVLWLTVVAGDLAAGPDASRTPMAIAALVLCIQWAIAVHGALRSGLSFVFLAFQVAYCCGYYGHWVSVDPASWPLPVAHAALVALFCEFPLPALRAALQAKPAWVLRSAVGWFVGAAVFVALSLSPAVNAPQFAWSLFTVLPIAGSMIGKTPRGQTLASSNPLARFYLFGVSLMIAIAMPTVLAVASVGLMSLWILNELWNANLARQAR